jgi:hypothetical protein
VIDAGTGRNGTCDLHVKNNIIVGPNSNLLKDARQPADTYCPPVLDFNNNLYFGALSQNPVFTTLAGNFSLATWRSSLGQDKQSLVADPVFNNVAGGDFSVTTASPALKAGAGIFVPYDSVGKTRGVTADIGAYQISQPTLSANAWQAVTNVWRPIWLWLKALWSAWF